MSNNIIQQSSIYIGQPIPNTQHRPVCLQTHAVIRAQSVPFKRRFNYKKARWKEFTEGLENKIQQIDPILSNYDKFVNLVKETSRKHIPRGCRSQYVPGLDKTSARTFGVYKREFDRDPFAANTILLRQNLMQLVNDNRRQKWKSLVENMDMI